jgi:hypothetical protein
MCWLAELQLVQRGGPALRLSADLSNTWKLEGKAMSATALHGVLFRQSMALRQAIAKVSIREDQSGVTEVYKRKAGAPRLREQLTFEHSLM